MSKEVLNHRYDFVMLFDVENGNPNGDPDAGNSPRVDAETGFGYVTDVCLKRKIRNYVDLYMETYEENEERKNACGILIKPDKVLNRKFTEAHEALQEHTKDATDVDPQVQARDYMCSHYFDVRTFGAVMSTGKEVSCGIVRGPVQINFARSLSPVNVEDVTITRIVRTKEEKEKEQYAQMGKKSIVPYGLYRAEGYVSAALAKKTGMTKDDLSLLWDAIINMFEHDHSAARGKMCMRKLYVFEHESILGNCPSHILFDKISVVQKEDVPPRHFSDYEIIVDTAMPSGVKLEEKL